MNALETVVLGTLTSDGTLQLDEKPNLPPGRVRVTLLVEQPSVRDTPTILDTLERIRQEQEARGFQGRSKEEIDASIRELREEPEYEARWKLIDSQREKRPPE